VESFTGFGLNDRQVMDTVRDMADPYPHFGGTIAAIGQPNAPDVSCRLQAVSCAL
jgi:hypothetical protein